MKRNELYYDKLRHSEKIPFCLPQYRFIFWKRMTERFRSGGKNALFVFSRIIYEHYKTKYGMDVPAKVVIGRGLRIEHMGGIVINVEATIGCNATLSNGILIGSQSRGIKKGAPSIGNNVWIGSNAIIVGKIRIGNNVLIAPGAYVNFEVPDNSIVLGNPGFVKHSMTATQSYTLNPISADDYNM